MPQLCCSAFLKWKQVGDHTVPTVRAAVRTVHTVPTAQAVAAQVATLATEATAVGEAMAVPAEAREEAPVAGSHVTIGIIIAYAFTITRVVVPMAAMAPAVVRTDPAVVRVVVPVEAK